MSTYWRQAFTACFTILFVLFTSGGWETCQPPGSLTGDLIKVTIDDAVVGVHLGEVPEDQRDVVAAELLAQPEEFWRQRAEKELEFGHYRLVYLAFYYLNEDGTDLDDDPETPNGSLPLPPKAVWSIDLGTAQRGLIDGHDYVFVEYDFESYIVAKEGSAAAVTTALDHVGGKWVEELIVPADPELLMQRTGNACINEFAYPPNGYDVENVWLFYDQTCTADNELCHLTEPAAEDCLTALDAHAGSSALTIEFERRPYTRSRANQYRVQDLPLTVGGDLVPSTGELGMETNKTSVRYFPADSCEEQEQCIGDSGWRVTRDFTSVFHNIGASPVLAGNVDQVLEDYHWFHFHECHQHYHFEHYGEFDVVSTSGSGAGEKLSFCLESTNRLSNNESTPLVTLYQGCIEQGIESGYGDQYQHGLPCQWVDITDLPAGPARLESQANPDGLLCEGLVNYDANGDLIWVDSQLVAEDGHPIFKPECTLAPDCQDESCDPNAEYDALVNNHAEIEIELLASGEGFVTEDCARGQLGPLRDCGYEYLGAFDCAAGQEITHNVVPNGQVAPVVRICHKSDVRGAGTACTYAAPGLLANVNVALAQEVGTQVTFTCPEMLDADAPGEGGYSVYLGEAAAL